MLAYTAASVLAFAAAYAVAIPAVSPHDWSLDDQPDLSVGSLIRRQESVNPVYPPPLTFDDANAGANEVAIDDANTAPAPPPPPSWPYLGRFEGTNPGGSCGEFPLPDAPPLPGFDDCLFAAGNWLGRTRYYGRDGRQTEQRGNCVTVWHPDPASAQRASWSVTGTDLATNFEYLTRSCQAGQWAEQYVSRYAHFTVEGVGECSIYGVDDEEDYTGDEVNSWD